MVSREQRFAKSNPRRGAVGFAGPVVILALAAGAGLSAGCSFTEVSEEVSPPKAVVLVDRTGKHWDVSTAVWKYGFDADRFESGLGPHAITPIIEPEMLSPGVAGYPARDDTFLVVGTSINGDTRAYAKQDLVENEVVDEYIGGAAAAVVYGPLVDLSAVYRRDIDGTSLTLGASGWTYDRLSVLYDLETESIWYRLPGTNSLTCIAGTYEGRELPELVSVVEPWDRWTSTFPDTKILEPRIAARR